MVRIGTQNSPWRTAHKVSGPFMTHYLWDWAKYFPFLFPLLCFVQQLMIVLHFSWSSIWLIFSNFFSPRIKNDSSTNWCCVFDLQSVHAVWLALLAPTWEISPNQRDSHLSCDAKAKWVRIHHSQAHSKCRSNQSCSRCESFARMFSAQFAASGTVHLRTKSYTLCSLMEEVCHGNFQEDSRGDMLWSEVCVYFYIIYIYIYYIHYTYMNIGQGIKSLLLTHCFTMRNVEAPFILILQFWHVPKWLEWFDSRQSVLKTRCGQSQARSAESLPRDRAASSRGVRGTKRTTWVSGFEWSLRR